VRETLFNWLGHHFSHDLSGLRCVDAYAGTGALGLEAASRGAASVLLIENNTRAAAAISASIAKLKIPGCEVLKQDAVFALAGLVPASVDVVFVDPPFDAAVHSIAAKAALRALKPEGVLYVEAPDEATLDAVIACGFVERRRAKAGSVWFGLCCVAAQEGMA
jgi:16S rRNA (guanine966-N2)-methyltransferase